MILDSRLMFADGVTVVGSTGSNAIGNVIDLGSAHRDVGNGNDNFFFVEVTADIQASGGAGTIQFQLVSSASSTLSSPTVHATSASIVTGASAAGLAKAGSQIAMIDLPAEGAVYLEYLGLIAVVGTQNITAGTIKSGITLDQHGWQSYPRNYF